MRAVWRFAAATAVALGAPAAAGAAGAATAATGTPSAPPARTIAPPSAVTSLSVVPGTGRAEVVIGVSGAVKVSDFRLDGPHRVVVDLAGARLSTPSAYDKVRRGGITNVRASQYKAEVVRIVVDLTGPRGYKVARTEGEVRISIEGSDRFAAWSSQPGGPTVVRSASMQRVAEPADAAPATDVDTSDAQDVADGAHAADAAAPTTPAPAPAAKSATVSAKAPAAATTPAATTAARPPASPPAPTARAESAAEQANRVEQANRMEREHAERAERAERMDRAERAAAAEAAERADRTERNERAESAQRAERTERTGRRMVRRVSSAPQPRITVNYQDADIRDVLAAFAAFSGRTIVAGRDVNGTVTAEIRDQPWDVALRAILGSQGLAATEEASGIIAVDSYKNLRNKQASEPLVTQIVSINYAKAPSLVPTVRTLLNSVCVNVSSPAEGAPEGAEDAAPRVGSACEQRGSVSADSSTNSLIITAVSSRIDDIVKYVQALDVRTPQVAIKAKIIFVNRTKLEDIGLTYDLGTNTQFFSRLVQRQQQTGVEPVDSDGDGVPDRFRPTTEPVEGDRIDLGGRVFSALANANNRIIGPALNVVYSATMGKYTLTTFLDALQETRLADLQAEPTIVTLDNRRAEILVGQEIPIRVLDAGSGTGTPGSVNVPRATVTLKEAGIILSVTPHITNNRQVLMAIHAENSSAEQVQSSDVGFVFSKQRADNQLLVGDGETAVIGGLTVTEVVLAKSGIPFLMDIPYLGKLFRRTSKLEQKRDLLILVTPHIVDEGERVPGPGNGR